MMHALAAGVAMLGLGTVAGCATAAIYSDENAPEAVVQALDLTCGWLLDSSAPPTKQEMERLNWRQFMSRERMVIPDFMQRQVEGPPALAGYRLRFGETGDIIASIWEDRCYGILSADLLPDEAPERTRRSFASLAKLEAWAMAKMPEASPGQLASRSGTVTAYVAKVNQRFAFSAFVRNTGGLEWRLAPIERLNAAPNATNQQGRTSSQ